MISCSWSMCLNSFACGSVEFQKKILSAAKLLHQTIAMCSKGPMVQSSWIILRNILLRAFYTAPLEGAASCDNVMEARQEFMPMQGANAHNAGRASLKESFASNTAY